MEKKPLNVPERFRESVRTLAAYRDSNETAEVSPFVLVEALTWKVVFGLRESVRGRSEPVSRTDAYGLIGSGVLLNGPGETVNIDVVLDRPEREVLTVPTTTAEAAMSWLEEVCSGRLPAWIENDEDIAEFVNIALTRASSMSTRCHGSDGHSS